MKSKKPHQTTPARPAKTAAAPVETVSAARLSDLRPDPRNANTGTERGAQMLEDSLRAYGAGRSLLVDKHGVVIAGNKTLEAAAEIGLSDVIRVRTDGRQLVVVERTDLDLAHDPRAMALAVADNRTAQIGLEWDPAALQALMADGADLTRLFTADELAAVLAGGADAGGGLTDPDAVPAVRETSVQFGDVYRLGRHRLACGDSTQRACVEALLAGSRPVLMVTDPPYGVNYDPAWRREAGVNNSERMGKVANDERADWTPAWDLFPGDVAYVWHAGLHGGEVEASLLAAGFQLRAQIVWRKPRIVLSRGHYHWQHEPAFYAVRKGRPGHWAGSRKQSTVWPVTSTVHRCQACGSVELESPPDGIPSSVWDIEPRDGTGDTTHGTQKPVECMARAMRNHAALEVYEPFSGSGTSLIAAEMLGRTCFAMELDPSYVQQAIDRWEAFTGGRAEKVA